MKLLLLLVVSAVLLLYTGWHWGSDQRCEGFTGCVQSTPASYRRAEPVLSAERIRRRADDRFNNTSFHCGNVTEGQQSLLSSIIL